MTYPFALGTAQLGSHYGITNVEGCPTDEEVDALLRFSLEVGISCIDSAFAYGTALERIARSLARITGPLPHIINKFSVNGDLDNIFSDLLNLKADFGGNQFYGLLIHDPLNLSVGNNKDKVLAFLNRAREEDIAAKFGVSIYEPKELEGILDVYPIDIVQCPVNLFDQRMFQSGLISELKKRNIEVHGRSLFLQGVLLADKLPAKLTDLQSEWDHYRNTLSNMKIEPLIFICNWIKSIKSIDKWVIGVNNQRELQQILRAYDASDAMEDFNWSIFHATRNSKIDPRTWAA